MVLKVKTTTEKMVAVKVIAISMEPRLGNRSPATLFKCSACHDRIGARRFSIAWVDTGKYERSMRLCWKCTQDAREDCKDVYDNVTDHPPTTRSDQS